MSSAPPVALPPPPADAGSAAPTITLYLLESSRAQRIAWLLEELNLGYDLVVFRKDGLLAPPELGSVHPLAKSPVVKIEPTGAGAPIVLAESGFIAQYLCEHFDGPPGAAARLIPPRWKEGMEGRVGGETEGWMRWMHLMHFAEGSFMPLIVVSLILAQMRGPRVPFIVRPIAAQIASRIAQAWVLPNARKMLGYVDSLLESSPDGGAAPFLCGPQVTAVDLILSFPILLSRERFDADDANHKFWRGGSVAKEFPRVWEYLDRLRRLESYGRAEVRVKQALETDDQNRQGASVAGGGGQVKG